MALNRLKTYTYSVDMVKGLKTVQQAIDRIALELKGNPIIEKDITINIDKGIYPGFKIPRGSLMPLLSAGFQLKIRSLGNFFPILDGAISPSGTHIGADIEASNPNVNLIGLRLQNFSVGIRASLNSHNPIIERCIVSNNVNVGIFIEQCSNTILANNIVTNGDFGVVTRLCKNIALLHNTIILNGTIGDGSSALWAQLANDYGGGQTDTGLLHIIGNIVWNITDGPSLILFQEDLEDKRVVSNFNDFVRTGDVLIRVEKKAKVSRKIKGKRVIDPRDSKSIFGLKEWRGLGFTNPDNTALDSKSISQDPKFLQVIKGRRKTNGLYIDLSLLPISPVLGIVPSFYFNAVEAEKWLPSYVDAPTLLNTDILNNTRLTVGTAAGANDKKSNAGYFGQDIFLSPRDLDPDKDCDVDPLRDLIYKRLDLWFPQLKVGYFSSHERQYYLYSKKHCRFLGECAVTEFRLPARVITDKPVKVSVAGENIRDPRYIDILGDSVILYHFDLDIQDGTEEFEIQCWIRQWNNITFGFSEFPVHYRFKINEGKTKYLIPLDYDSSGPVILTDDISALTDPEELSNREYRVSWDEGEQRAEITFSNNSNLFLNAQFDRFFGEGEATPYGWSSSSAIVETGVFFGKIQPVMGDNMCRISPSGHIRQLVPMTSGNYTFSWHSLTTTTGGNILLDSSGQYTAKLYNADLDSLGVTFSGVFDVTGNWTRSFVTFGNKDPNEDKSIAVRYPLSGLANHPDVPEVSAFADITLTNNMTGSDLWVDSLQYEEASRPTMYHRKIRFDEVTVEYETSDSKEFIDTRQAIAPVRNSRGQGFLYIPEIPASMYGGPRIEMVTTLNEYRWPEGRINVLPWARTTGKDKLRHKQVFNTVPERPKQRIDRAHVTFIPFEVAVVPDEIIARQDDKTGEGLYIICVNENGNPYALGNFFIQISEPLGRFPGWLHKKHFGAKEVLGSQILGKLDSGGSTHLLWIPPDGRSVGFVGSVPKRPKGASGDVVSSVEVNYRVNFDFHGNVMVLDDELNILPSVADTPNKNIYKPRFVKDLSIVELRYPPTPGSVVVSIGGKFLIETIIDSPNTDQFFVDYSDSQILLRGRPKEVTVEYRPSYIFINGANPYRIQFYHDQVFGTYIGPITVGYDALIDLEVHIGFPTTEDFLTKRVPLIAQNYLVSRDRNINSLSMEY